MEECRARSWVGDVVGAMFGRAAEGCRLLDWKRADEWQVVKYAGNSTHGFIHIPTKLHPQRRSDHTAVIGDEPTIDLPPRPAKAVDLTAARDIIRHRTAGQGRSQGSQVVTRQAPQGSVGFDTPKKTLPASQQSAIVWGWGWDDGGGALGAWRMLGVAKHADVSVVLGLTFGALEIRCKDAEDISVSA